MLGEFTEYNRRVNYYETDKMGIVHHSNYIRYFEEARLDMMKKVGLDYWDMEERGIIIPVLFVDCKYIKALRFDEDIVIQTKMTKYNGIKMEVAYEIYQKGSDELCTRGTTGHCFVTPDMKPIRMKREYPDLYEKLNQLLVQ